MRTAVFLLLATAALAQTNYRPVFHFSPSRNWINDPNGLVYHEGEYHLFYQYNPFGDRWGHMSWGHAVSRDLTRWRELPPALAEENGIMIFSGSAVVDARNTSGFGKGGEPAIIAIYTGHSNGLQTQNIAYSTDRGRTWIKFAGNPVIDIKEAEFRDPMVLWHETTRRWIMVVALAKAHKVRFYWSPDLKKWTALSDFGPAGARGIPNWECPSLFPLEFNGRKKWILIIGVGDGGPAGGSATQYFIGDFDGQRFVNDNPTDTVRWLDHGADFYAAQTWSDIPKGDGRRIVVAWMNNWKYADRTPTAPWRGQMSYPRSLEIRDDGEGPRLIQNPVRELERMRRGRTRVRNVTVARASEILGQKEWPEALEIVARFQLKGATDVGFQLRGTRAGYDAQRGVVYIDRTRSGNTLFHGAFAARHEAPLKIKSDRVELRILLDRSSVEVFADGGKAALTDLIFPNPADRKISVYASEQAPDVTSLEIWNLAETTQRSR